MSNLLKSSPAVAVLWSILKTQEACRALAVCVLTDARSVYGSGSDDYNEIREQLLHLIATDIVTGTSQLAGNASRSRQRADEILSELEQKIENDGQPSASYASGNTTGGSHDKKGKKADQCRGPKNQGSGQDSRTSTPSTEPPRQAGPSQPTLPQPAEVAPSQPAPAAQPVLDQKRRGPPAAKGVVPRRVRISRAWRDKHPAPTDS